MDDNQSDQGRAAIEVLRRTWNLRSETLGDHVWVSVQQIEDGVAPLLTKNPQCVGDALPALVDQGMVVPDPGDTGFWSLTSSGCTYCAGRFVAQSA